MPNGWVRNLDRRDAITGLLITLLGAALISEVDRLPVRAAMFPSALAWCLFVVGLSLLLWTLFQAFRGVAREEVNDRWIIQIIIPAVILFLAAMLLVLVGFYGTAPVLILVVHAWHTFLARGGMPSFRDFVTGAVLAIVATATMYLVFTLAIGLPAPSGRLF